jgi:hypothetical protein
MEALQITAIHEVDLPHVARFLASALDAYAPASAPWSVDVLLARLRWRLGENTARPPELELGHCLRAADGRIGGVNLVFPGWFRVGNRRLLGLGSCSFFVEASARLQGFFLFRRFLQTPGVDFYFATTCNEASGALWRKLGGRPVPDSDGSATLLLRPGPVAEELALRRRSGRVLAAMAGSIVQLATPFLALPGRGSRLLLRPCRDWDLLAALAEQHREPERLTAERSVAFLAWRYAPTPGREAPEVLEIIGPMGSLGWLAVCRQPAAGQHRPIRRLLLLDLVADWDSLNYHGLLAALRARYAGCADILTVPGRIARQSGVGRPLLWRRPAGEPAAYVLDRSAASPPLAEIADLNPADGDADD